MKSAVRVFPNDAVNQPAVRNTHWTVEVALPISKLMERNPLARRPADGVFWRVSAKASHFFERERKPRIDFRSCSFLSGFVVLKVNFSRVQWGVVADGSGYEKRPCCQSCATPGSTAEDNWVWSKQGAVAMHLPEVGEHLVISTASYIISIPSLIFLSDTCLVVYRDGASCSFSRRNNHVPTLIIMPSGHPVAPRWRYIMQ